jgi:hypothetical protein
LQTLIFPLNGGKDQALVVERQGEGKPFSATEQALALETQVVMKTAEIRYSLFGARTPPGFPTRWRCNWRTFSAATSISIATCARATASP